MWAFLLCIARKAYHAHLAVLMRLYTMLQRVCMLHAFDVLWLTKFSACACCMRLMSCG